MKNTKKDKDHDLLECKERIRALLCEYNCELISQDEWHGVLIRDIYTDRTIAAPNLR